jgi:hypothetical protein
MDVFYSVKKIYRKSLYVHMMFPWAFCTSRCSQKLTETLFQTRRGFGNSTHMLEARRSTGMISPQALEVEGKGENIFFPLRLTVLVNPKGIQSRHNL